VPNYSKLKDFYFQIILFLIAFSGGFLIVILYGLDNSNFGDSKDYLDSAKSFSDQSGYLREGLTLPFFRAPGLPFVISILWKIVGVEGIWIVKILNIACHAGSTLLVYNLALRILSKQQSFITGLVYSLNPFTLFMLIGVQTEPLITFLFLAFVSLATSTMNPFRSGALALATLACVAVRPEYLFIVIPALVYLMVRGKIRKRNINWFYSVGIILTLFSLMLWGQQNKQATGSFIPLTDAANFQLWQSSSKSLANNYPLFASYSPEFNSNQQMKLSIEMKQLMKEWGTDYSLGNIGTKSQYWKKAYLTNVKDHPLEYVQGVLYKAVIFWRPYLSPASYGLDLVLLSIVLILPLTLMLFFGVRKMVSKRKELEVINIFLIGLAVLTMIHSVQLPEFRYRSPVFIPIATLAAAYWIVDKIAQSKLFRKSPGSVRGASSIENPE